MNNREISIIIAAGVFLIFLQLCGALLVIRARHRLIGTRIATDIRLFCHRFYATHDGRMTEAQGALHEAATIAEFHSRPEHLHIHATGESRMDPTVRANMARAIGASQRVY